MRQLKKEHYRDDVPAGSEEGDSPTIQQLIEQLDRDLEETQHKAPRHNWNEADAHLQLLTSKTSALAFAIEKPAERHRSQVACGGSSQVLTARSFERTYTRRRSMSGLNGDKARFYRMRKAGIPRRARHRERLQSAIQEKASSHPGSREKGASV